MHNTTFSPALSMGGRLADHTQRIEAAVLAGEIDLLIVTNLTGQNTPFPVPMPDRPCIVFIGDDMQRALGPRAFHRKSLKMLVCAVESVVLVASGPITKVYDDALDVARSKRRPVVILETLPVAEWDWVNFLERHAPGKLRCWCVARPGRLDA